MKIDRRATPSPFPIASGALAVIADVTEFFYRVFFVPPALFLFLFVSLRLFSLFFSSIFLFAVIFFILSLSLSRVSFLEYLFWSGSHGG